MKFTRFYPSPTPVPAEPQGWINQASGVIEDNFLSIARSIESIGQDLTAPKDEYLVLTAGEALVAGDLVCLYTDGAMWKADASDSTYSTSLVAIATQTIASGSTGKFLIRGSHTTTGLTLGVPYFISTTGGTWQNISPYLSGEISRVIGYALTTTTMFFDPDNTWLEVA